MRRRLLLPLAVAALGLAAAAAVAAAGDVAAGEAAAVVLESSVAAAVAGALAWVALRAMRRSRIGSQLAVAALAPVLGVGAGVVWATSEMFLNRHDLWVLWVVLTAAGAAGVIVAILLGRRVAEASDGVRAMTRRLGADGPRVPLSDAGRGRAVASPYELSALAAELEETASRLAEAQEQAAALERSRRELVAWVSHDLRTPLAGIRAMVEALEDGVVADGETVARYHRTIRREADRLAGLVDDLFELSRIQSGSLSLVLERVSLDELVSDAIAGASISASSKDVELLGSVAQPAPVVRLATPEMARVVRNLLDNAIRHTPPGGTVVVHAALDATGTAAEVWVQDGCGGIPDHDLEQVFELAYRGDAARTPGGGGAGLGLAVARGLVEAHDGRISVRNEDGGCRFTVRLPLSPPAAG